MVFWSDDPVADADRYFAEKERELERLPVCECCGEPIQQEKAVYYNDSWFCEDCEDEAWQTIREDFLESVDADG